MAKPMAKAMAFGMAIATAFGMAMAKSMALAKTKDIKSWRAQWFSGNICNLCRGRSVLATICKMLLALGADPSLKDDRGRTALDWARLKDESECVALLQPVTAS